MNGIAPDKSAALLLYYDIPTSEVAAKGMKSITSNYMLPPVEVDQLSRSSGEPEDLNPRFGGQVQSRRNLQRVDDANASVAR